MQDFRTNPVVLAPRFRLAGACAALSASVVVLSVVVAMFDQASPERWLPNTPDAIAQSARCDHASSRAARNQCMQQVIARWDAAGRQGQEWRLAIASRSPQAGN